MRMMDTADTGSETANHRAQSNFGSMSCKAIKFCGEDMGELWPPMLAASAIAS